MCVIPECSTPHRRRGAEAEAVGDNLQKQKKEKKRGGGATFLFFNAAVVIVGVSLHLLRATHTNTQTSSMRPYLDWRGGHCVFS